MSACAIAAGKPLDDRTVVVDAHGANAGGGRAGGGYGTEMPQSDDAELHVLLRRCVDPPLVEPSAGGEASAPASGASGLRQVARQRIPNGSGV